MSNIWSNKIVSVYPCMTNGECVGYAVVSKSNKFFYSCGVDLFTLLSEVKSIITFRGIEGIKSSHYLESLYYQLNPEIKFQTLEDIVKQECYKCTLNEVFYSCRVEGDEKAVIAADFMLKYYLKNYKRSNKQILAIDNALLDSFSSKKRTLLVDQTKVRTKLSILQKDRWDLERKIFNEVGFPVWTSHNIKSLKTIKEIEQVKTYKEDITNIEKYLNLPKLRLQFDTTATATGRILCRDKLNGVGLFAPDNRYKDLFYCKKDKMFISADYKRQEAFILSTVSGDRQLYEDVKNEDFYSRLARWVLRDTSKQIGKTLFYAVIYGSSIKSLSEEFNISEHRAQEAIYKVKSRYNNLTKWLTNFKEETNYFGRPLHNNTVNAYIQSTAADIIRQKLVETKKFNPILVLADNIVYKVSIDNLEKKTQTIEILLNTTSFKGLEVQLKTSSTLKF